MTTHRVLHIIETDGPGGAETVLVDLLRGLPRPHESWAVVPTESGWLGRTLSISERRIATPSPRNQSGWLDREYLLAIQRTIRSTAPSVVHAHSFDSGFYAALALLPTRIPLVVTFHGASDVDRRGARNRLKWLAYRRVSRIACVSEALKRQAALVEGIPKTRLRIIHNGSDMTRLTLERSPQLRARLRIPRETALIGALGNVRAPKGYDLLLQAMAILRSQGEDVHLVIAGDDTGALGDALRRQRSELNLESHVTLLGYQDDPGAFLAGIDLFVLSSTSEGFSISSVQASAAGLPIVATRSGGPEEIIVDDVTGRLVAPGSPEALAAGLRELHASPALARRLGEAAHHHVWERFSLPAMLGAYQALYNEVRR